MNNTSAPNEASRIVIAANKAASVEVSAGAAIQCLGGKLWLTQDGDARDHVVPAGTAFCTDRGGRVVVSAIDGESVVVVHASAPGHWRPGTVTIDSIERFKHGARHAQSEYVAGLFARLFEWLRGGITRKPVRPEPFDSGRAYAQDRLHGSGVDGRVAGFRGYVRSL